MCVCERVSERVSERESQRERGSARERVSERESMCVRERVSESVSERLESLVVARGTFFDFVFNQHIEGAGPSFPGCSGYFDLFKEDPCILGLPHRGMLSDTVY